MSALISTAVVVLMLLNVTLCAALKTDNKQEIENENGESHQTKKNKHLANQSESFVSQLGKTGFKVDYRLVSKHFILCTFNLCTFNRCYFNRSQFQPIAFSTVRNFDLN